VTSCLTVVQDFSHDNEMIEILTAMNVIPVSANLTKFPALADDVSASATSSARYRATTSQTYIRLSNMIPFGAHLVVERIACDLGDWEPDPNAPTGPGNGDGDGDGADDRQRDGKKDHVRIYLKWV
jgi:hypothetical protein